MPLASPRLAFYFPLFTSTLGPGEKLVSIPINAILDFLLAFFTFGFENMLTFVSLV